MISICTYHHSWVWPRFNFGQFGSHSQAEHCSCAHRTRTYHARPCWWRTSTQKRRVHMDYTASRSHVAPWDWRTLLLRAWAFTSFHSSEQNEELTYDVSIISINIYQLYLIYLIVLLIISHHSSSHLTIACLMWRLIMLCSMVVLSYRIVSCVLLHLIPMILHNITYDAGSIFQFSCSFFHPNENTNETLHLSISPNFTAWILMEKARQKSCRNKPAKFPNQKTNRQEASNVSPTLILPHSSAGSTSWPFRNLDSAKEIILETMGFFWKFWESWESQIAKFAISHYLKESQRNTRGREVWPSERSSTCRNLRFRFHFAMFTSALCSCKMEPIKNQFLSPKHTGKFNAKRLHLSTDFQRLQGTSLQQGLVFLQRQWPRLDKSVSIREAFAKRNSHAVWSTIFFASSKSSALFCIADPSQFVFFPWMIMLRCFDASSLLTFTFWIVHWGSTWREKQLSLSARLDLLLQLQDTHHATCHSWSFTLKFNEDLFE